MLEADYIVVGSGLTGATIARILSDNGKSVVVLDQREHLGGNVHDWTHPSGIRIHTYGPHYFRTSSESIWRYVGRFATFFPYAAVLKAMVDGALVPYPVTRQLVEKYAESDWQPAGSGPPENFEDAVLRKMPVPVYRTFVEGYTRKQWGVAPATLSAQLAARIDLRDAQDMRLKTSKHQGIPSDGYAAFMTRMLSGIHTILGVSFETVRASISPRSKIVYTGPIDAYFGFDLGRLAWRGQRRRHAYHSGALKFPVAQVNLPSPCTNAIRVIEWAHLMPPGSDYRGTVLTYETPFSPDNPADFEYPFPDDANQKLYERYSERAEAIPNLLICGRLGEYRYYDMDQAIGRAMLHARRLLGPAET